MNKYIAIYNGKQYEIEASTLWEAKTKAIALIRIPKNKQGLLSIMLVEVEGREITTNTGSL